MKTWNTYKEQISKTDPIANNIIREVETAVREMNKIEEQLNKIDLHNDNKYDLLNTYESVVMSEEDNKTLSEMLESNAGAKKIHDFLCESLGEDFDEILSESSNGYFAYHDQIVDELIARCQREGVLSTDSETLLNQLSDILGVEQEDIEDESYIDINDLIAFCQRQGVLPTTSDELLDDLESLTDLEREDIEELLDESLSKNESLGEAKSNYPIDTDTYNELLARVETANAHGGGEVDASISNTMYISASSNKMAGLSLRRISKDGKKEYAKFVSRWGTKSLEEINKELTEQEWELLESLKEDFDEDEYDDFELASIYGGDFTYCPVCGARMQYDEDGDHYCPKCKKSGHTLSLIRRGFIKDEEESLSEDTQSLSPFVEKQTKGYSKDKGFIQCNRGAQADEIVSLLKKHYPSVSVEARGNRGVTVKYSKSVNSSLEEDTDPKSARRERMNKFHKVFDSFGKCTSDDYYKAFDLFYDASYIDIVDHASKLKSEYDGQKVKYRFTVYSDDYKNSADIHYDPYQNYVGVVVDNKKIDEDTIKGNFSDLRKALKRFDENGKYAKQGDWKIGKGGYDLNFEVYYKGEPIIQGMSDGEKTRVNTVVDTDIAKQASNVVCAVYDGCYIPVTEDTVKQNGYWVNKGKEGTHGKFKTKKAADAQRKAMFSRGFKEGIEDEEDNSSFDYKGHEIKLTPYGYQVAFDNGEEIEFADDKEAMEYIDSISENNGHLNEGKEVLRKYIAELKTDEEFKDIPDEFVIHDYTKDDNPTDEQNRVFVDIVRKLIPDDLEYDDIVISGKEGFAYDPSLGGFDVSGTADTTIRYTYKPDRADVIDFLVDFLYEKFPEKFTMADARALDGDEVYTELLNHFREKAGEDANANFDPADYYGG
ncbi:MAG: hypothetical protein J6S67_19425 [Methanobrevibacter sp.]|nr:hypothetical protein [Methanobrevibacter sp.]